MSLPDISIRNLFTFGPPTLHLNIVWRELEVGRVDTVQWWGSKTRYGDNGDFHPMMTMTVLKETQLVRNTEGIWRKPKTRRTLWSTGCLNTSVIFVQWVNKSMLGLEITEDTGFTGRWRECPPVPSVTNILLRFHGFIQNGLVLHPFPNFNEKFK